MTPPVRLLLISGSLRAASTNTALLRTARALAPAGVEATLYTGLAELPHFNPDDDRAPLHPAVAALRTGVGQAGALLFCTPEYAGALPGSFKNLLDWLVGGEETSGKPAAWVNVSSPASPTGGADAHDSLGKVLRYAGIPVVEEACLRLPLTRADVGADGLLGGAELRGRVAGVLEVLARHVHARP